MLTNIDGMFLAKPISSICSCTYAGCINFHLAVELADS